MENVAFRLTTTLEISALVVVQVFNHGPYAVSCFVMCRDIVITKGPVQMFGAVHPAIGFLLFFDPPTGRTAFPRFAFASPFRFPR